MAKTKMKADCDGNDDVGINNGKNSYKDAEITSRWHHGIKTKALFHEKEKVLWGIDWKPHSSYCSSFLRMCIPSSACRPVVFRSFPFFSANFVRRVASFPHPGNSTIGWIFRAFLSRCGRWSSGFHPPDNNNAINQRREPRSEHCAVAAGIAVAVAGSVGKPLGNRKKMREPWMG